MSCSRSILGASALFLSISSAYAEAPLATDDAGTLDQGGLKIESVVGRDDETRGSELLFGFAPLDNVEIGFAVARESGRDASAGSRQHGNGFAIKWIFP